MAHGVGAAARDRAIVAADALDLVGVAVFAVSGALAAGRIGLDLLGVVVLAAVTAIGGGTLRDLLMTRPVFWLRDARYLTLIVASALATVVASRTVAMPAHALLVADALGLALFAITGAQRAEAAGLPAIVVVVLGTLTGSGGGVLRDVLSAQVPVILRSNIYASAAIAGIAVYLLAGKLRLGRAAAVGAGIAVVAGLRLAAIAFDWQLPVFHLPT